jgi:cation-transporting ATPase E
MESGSPATRGAADLVLVADEFAVLPKAVVEGQRIVAAMEATMILLISRTLYVLIIIVVAALAGLPFPLTPRQNSVLAFVTVGIPGLVLALWVLPHRPPRSLLATTLRVAIPASLMVAFVAFSAYVLTISAGLGINEARTILTTMAAFCGLGLLQLVQPASESGNGLRSDMPWIVAAVMVVIFVAILEVPLARDFYELSPLPPAVIGLLGLVGLIWALAVRLFHRAVQRFEDALWTLAQRKCLHRSS